MAFAKLKRPAVFLAVLAICAAAFFDFSAFTGSIPPATYATNDGSEGSAEGSSITIDYLGRSLTVMSGDETVGQLLSRLDLSPAEDEVLSVDPQTLTYDGMELVISQQIQEEQVYMAAIDHETEYFRDATLPEGAEKILLEGSDGEVRCVARVTYVNGKETSREILEQKVTRAAVNTVIAVGTGLRDSGKQIEKHARIENGTITLPTGEVLSYKGQMKVRATAYTHTDEGCNTITATGTVVHIGTVAVDPRVIPYGTRMFIVTSDGMIDYGLSVAEDCGGAIKGDRIDLYFPTYEECMDFGRRDCTVYFLG